MMLLTLSPNFQSKKEEVISELDDLERKDIIDLLRYEDSSRWING
jgi:uncharacterized protein (DUF433 family)